MVVFTGREPAHDGLDPGGLREKSVGLRERAPAARVGARPTPVCRHTHTSSKLHDARFCLTEPLALTPVVRDIIERDGPRVVVAPVQEVRPKHLGPGDERQGESDAVVAEPEVGVIALQGRDDAVVEHRVAPRTLLLMIAATDRMIDLGEEWSEE